MKLNIYLNQGWLPLSLRTEEDELMEQQLTTHAPPALFIFHMSRTGSTLASQMIRSLPDVEVISEPGIVNQLLSKYGDDQEDILEAQIRFMLNWFDHVLGKDKKLVFKMSSWVAFHLNRFKKWYPDVNSLFLYRDAREVLAAVVDQPPGAYRRPRYQKVIDAKACDHELSGQLTHGFRGRVEINSQSTFVEHVARFLGQICSSAISEKDYLSFLNYKAITTQLPTFLTQNCGFKLTQNALNNMTEVSKIDAKSFKEDKLFDNDTDFKRQQLTPLMIEMAEQFIQQYIDDMSNLEGIQQ